VLEAYHATFAAVLWAKGPLTAKGLQKAASEQFEHAGLLGEVDRREAANPVTFANAVDLLVRRDVLEHAPVTGRGDRPREIAYVRGTAFDDLPALCELLATALSAR
jgi:hypothetical protein